MRHGWVGGWVGGWERRTYLGVGLEVLHDNDVLAIRVRGLANVIGTDVERPASSLF